MSSAATASTDAAAAVQALGAAFWTWRTEQQPASADDIPRLPRRHGWLPVASPAAVAAARAERDDLQARWAAVDPAALDVAAAVDHRLLGSALARVTWELDVLQSWRRDPVFHVHQALGQYFDLLLTLPPFDAARSAWIVAALRHVPVAVDHAVASLQRPSGPLTAAAGELLDGLGTRLRESVEALAGHLAADHRGAAVAAAEPAVDALEALRAHLARSTGLDDAVAVGDEAFTWFLRNVALMAETPDELLRSARQEWERAVVWEAVARRRAAGVPLGDLPGSAGEQVEREADAEAEVRRFLVDGGWLDVPPTVRRYLNAELPDYLAPLRWFGVCDDLTDDHRLDTDGVSYVPAPGPDLPYFYAANARDPRAGIAHEGAHYQQLAMAKAHDDPIRRRYYDSGPNEGIAFYHEEYLLQAGLFDDAPHTRSVIWNFARLRALRVEVDVRLATGSLSLDDAVEVFVRRVPMDRETAFEECCMYAGTPGLALSYQTGKRQLTALLADAIERRGPDIDLGALHADVWRNGNVPFGLLRWELLGDRSVLDAIDADALTGAPPPRAAFDAGPR